MGSFLKKWRVIFAAALMTMISLEVCANHAPVYYFSSANYNQDTVRDRYPTAMAALQAGWNAITYRCRGTDGTYVNLISVASGLNEPGNGYPVGSLWYPYSEIMWCAGGVNTSARYYLEPMMQQWSACSADTNQTYYPGRPCPTPSSVDSDKSRGNVVWPDCACGDPIDPATGNAFLTKTEYRGNGPFPLEFTWTYNSSGVSTASSPTDRVLGANRTLNYLRSVRVYTFSAGNLTSAYLTRGDGKTYIADFANDVWTLDADVDGQLTSTQDSNGNFTGFSYLNELGQTESYSAIGDLLSITDRNGLQQTLTRNVIDQISTVQDSFGRTLAFAYDAQGRLSQLTQPDGGVITFVYDTNNNLQQVTYPDNRSVQYNYGQTAYTSGATLTHALTSMVDESGVNIDTTTYDATGRAIGNTLASGVSNYALNYQVSQYVVTAAVVTGPLGATSTINFQPSLGINRPLHNSTSCAGCTTLVDSYNFGSNGLVSTHTDGLGNIASYTYENAGLLSQRIDAQGTTSQRTTSFSWDDALRLPLLRTISDAGGNAISSIQWLYGNTGQLLARCEIDPANSAAVGYVCSNAGVVPAGVRRWTYTYCTAIDTTQCPAVGLMLMAVGPRTDIAQITAYGYYMTSSAVNCGAPGAACYQAGDLHTVSDALGHVTTIASYDAGGRITRLSDANGINTDLTYTQRGWLASRTVDGAAINFSYTPYGAVQSITDADGVTTTYGYDTAHRLVKITDAQGNYVQYTLDAAGNKTAEQAYDVGGALHKALVRNFNSLGQLTKLMDGLNRVVFDASASSSYGANGNLVQSADGLGVQRLQGYDALNRLVQTIDNYNGTDTATQNTATKYSYDSLDRLTQIVDPSSLNTTYSYDGLSDATGQVSPDTGTTRRTFDAAGNVLTRTDAKGITVTTTYDVLNRPLTISYPDNTQNITYTYDEANSVTGCSSSYPVGRLTRILENGVTTIYCYDALGHVIEAKKVTEATTNTTGYSYTAAGRLSAIVYSDGAMASYVRDGDGRVQSISAAPPYGVATTVVSSVTYQPFGPVSGYTLGNGQRVTRTYDANYRLTDLSSPAFTLHVARDAMGDIMAIGNAADANPAAETYSYDPLYRLTALTEANGNVSESVTYNPTGDRLSKTGSGLGTGAYSYKPNTHQLVTIGNSALTVDANGNTTAISGAGSVYGFGYSDRNRMTLAQLGGTTIANYTYDALGQRIQKTANGQTESYVYNEAGQLLAEYGATNRDYIWMDDLPVANIDTAIGSSAVKYVTADQLGTPRAIADATGHTVWQLPYQGNPWAEQSPTSNAYTYNLRFTGQYFDQETGHNYNVNRDYDSSTGRYIESDPIGLVGGVNTYAYVNGSPLDYKDSLGLAQCTLIFSGGKGYMECVPDDPNNSPVSIPVASGNNGGGLDCKNNSACQDLVGQGPIPSGCWQWTSGYTSKPNGRVLQPCPGWPDHGRTNIRSHSCANAFGPSKIPPFCSDGCVTGSASDMQSLNKLLDAEPNSTLWVNPPATSPAPAFDDSILGRGN